ncbi:MAG: sensor histidine kinase [Streptosporangiaceae bacterium]
MDHPGSRPTSWTAGRLGGVSWRGDLGLPAILLVIQLAAAGATVAGHHPPTTHLGAADWVLLVVGPLALVFRRRWPVAVLWVAFAARLPPSGAWSANLSLIVAFFLAATGGHRRWAWAAIVVGYLSSVWLAPLAYGNPGVSLTFALALAGWLAVLVIAAEVVRLHRERSVETRAARVVDARRRASEERLQMARDLHDVIGHHISLINVQAAVALDLMENRPEQARSALTAIEGASREALDELRTMLAALRRDGEEPPRAPTPGLDHLDELMELTRAAGISVTVQTVGDRQSLPAAVDLAAYRIIQESLTNVARHAALSRATVRLVYGPDGLDIEVADVGRSPAANGSSSRPGTGNGIAGMRERAVALGGWLDTGPRAGGGFVVTAHLPSVGSS